MQNNQINQEELVLDIQEASDIQAVSESKGGKLITKLLLKDIGTVLEKMLAQRATYTQSEFVAGCSDIKSKLDVLKLLSRAESNKIELESILKEIIQ